MINIEEIWKDIEGYENYYQVSNKGRVRSLDRLVGLTRLSYREGAIKVPKRNSDGYCDVTLSMNGRDKTFRIHRLVAKAFLPNPYGYKEVNHINFNRADNNVENLEWCSHENNIGHSARNFSGENNPNYGNDTLRKYYKEHPDAAMRLCSRPHEKNGRSVKIALYDKDMRYIKTFDWIGGCAEFLKEEGYTAAKVNTIRSGITKAVKNDSVYLNHYYKSVA